MYFCVIYELRFGYDSNCLSNWFSLRCIIFSIILTFKFDVTTTCDLLHLTLSWGGGGGVFYVRYMGGGGGVRQICRTTFIGPYTC